MPTIYITGLGAGGAASLPYGTLQLLRSGHPVLLRTERHPVVADLQREGVLFTSLDDYYETAEEFSEVYERIAERVMQVAEEQGVVIFAVPGHPAVAERAVRLLVERAPAREMQIEWGPGQSFLDDLLLRLGVDPVEGLIMLDAAELQARDLAPRLHTVIVQMYNRDRAAEVKAALAEVYGDEWEVTIARAVGVPGQELFTRLPIYELDREVAIDHLTSLYVPPLTQRAQRLGEWDELVAIVSALRSPEDGCPWDIEQTHESLRPYVLEEAYEVADAIDRGEPEGLAGELGDLLLQVLLHSQISSEEGYFQVRDVVRLLSEKLLRRHPHVFGNIVVHDVQGVKETWQAIKAQEQRERGETPISSLCAKVKQAQPPMLESMALQRKTSEVGFDWPSVEGALAKLREESVEVEQAQTAAEQEAEIGDLLFSAINVARHLGVDPERALSGANQRFRRRFSAVEAQLHEHKIDINDAGLAILEEFWQNAKDNANS